MKLHYLFSVSAIATFLLCSQTIFSQSVSGTLIDKKTQETIPFATVQLGENYGVITNQEGDFNLSTAGFSENDSLVFSSMGYQRKAIALKDFSEGDVFLFPSVEQLDEVLLLDKKLTALEVMQKVNENKEKNYAYSNTEFTVFHRSTNQNTFLDFGFEVRKAEYFDKKTLRKFNTTIDSLAETVKGVPTNFYRAYLAKIATGDSVKVHLKKATQLINEKKTKSLDVLTENVMDGIIKNLKTANTFKVRTGIIPIADSLDVSESFNEDDNDIDSLKTKSVSYSIENILPQKSLETTGSSTISIGAGGGSGAGLTFDFITEMDDYDYKIEDISTFNGELIYLISFAPDRGLFSGNGKYTGTLYVSADSFAVLKANYQLAEGEHGAKFRMKFLLGVAFEEKEKSGSIIYEKNDADKYVPKYIQVAGLRYGYFERFFVLKENAKRRDRMKLKFEVTLEFNNGYHNEWLFLEAKNISAEEYTSFEENEGIPVEQISKYNPEIWKDYNILAPTEAIRDYRY